VAEPVIRVLPHSPEEFSTAAKLAEWIGTELKKDGIYLIASTSRVRDLRRGSICLFMKDKKVLGEGLVKDFDPYVGKERSPATEKPYEGVITFTPSSLRRYVRPLGLDEIKRLTGKSIGFRSGGRLDCVQYIQCLSEVAENGFY